MKQFNIPPFYRSGLISKLKEHRRITDPRKKDFSPTVLNFGPVSFIIARHFGFCYGVENAIEISYKAVEENPGKRVFLLSQMIHNPDVNADLQSRGVRFVMDTEGNQIIPWEELTAADVLIIPAFGTTLEIEQIISNLGIEVHKYNTTCPFVERVWKKSEKLGKDNYSIIIHGKPNHEETRATFSHSKAESPSLVIKDIKEAAILGRFMLGQLPLSDFELYFANRYSAGFNPSEHLNRIGVVNQTTMLASETQEISDYLKNCMLERFGETNLQHHFADTRDTLCYATNDNQSSTLALLEEEADLAIVVGGYNSSNTSHLVELCEQKFRTFFISSDREILSENEIFHFDIHHQQRLHSINFLPNTSPVKIVLTSGASCPDSIVDKVIEKICGFYSNVRTPQDVFEEMGLA